VSCKDKCLWLADCIPIRRKVRNGSGARPLDDALRRTLRQRSSDHLVLLRIIFIEVNLDRLGAKVLPLSCGLALNCPAR
jgi:hypothetical protein